MPSETIELLHLARDAWDSGRLSESWRLMAMVEVDCEYDRRTARREVPEFYIDSGPEEWDLVFEQDRVPAPIGEQVAAYRAEIAAIDWFAWQKERRGRATTTASMGDFLRSVYTSESISCFSALSLDNPFFSFMRRA